MVDKEDNNKPQKTICSDKNCYCQNLKEEARNEWHSRNMLCDGWGFGGEIASHNMKEFLSKNRLSLFDQIKNLFK